MRVFQVISVTLLLTALLTASAQVLVAGKCPRPAVVRFFDTSMVNIYSKRLLLSSAKMVVSCIFISFNHFCILNVKLIVTAKVVSLI